MHTTTPPIDLLIVGAGFGGLYMLHTARQRGLTALVVEAAGGVGGTWYHNRYPGARVELREVFRARIRPVRGCGRYLPDVKLLRLSGRGHEHEPVA